MALDDDPDPQDVASEAAHALGLDGERIDIEQFSFTDIDGPGLEWHVRSFHWVEGLSETYEIVIDILTEDLAADCDTLLGAKCTFEIARGELARTAYGIIHRVDYLGITSDKQMVRVYVVPAFRLLAQQVDTRMWQGMTAVEIVKEVLEAALGEYERQVDVDAMVKGTYNKRDYCVQYRESNFDFVSRLLEEEGIAYIFQPDDEARAEKLVLCDNNDDYADVRLVLDEEVPIIADRPETADRESLRYFDWSQAEQPNAVVTRAFNWKTPPSLDGGSHMRIDEQHDRPREHFLHDDSRQIVDDVEDDGFNGQSMAQREPMAGRRLELFTRATAQGRGRGNVICFAPGLKFQLAEHIRLDLDGQKFLITRVVHRGDAPDVSRGDEATPQARYDNTFESIQEAQVFRPALVTPRPRVYGPETAIVVGPEGEEIHTDKFGRIKIHFHWDRLQPADDGASCWVRVAQAWAGSGWGTWFIPRIGMEVVVEFLEGNPDRPLVTGCVYNGANALPYALPDEKTKSTIKSNSSLGGSGFNEFRFEDLKGSEEVFLHAEKDLNEVIENNHTLRVGVDQTYQIGQHQTINVEGDQKVTVTGSQFVTVKGEPKEGAYKGSVHDITGKFTVNASDLILMKAPNSITLQCMGSSIVLEPGKISLVAGGHATVVLDANVFAKASGGANVLLDGNVAAKSAAGSKVVLDGNACMQSSGGSKVVLDGNALVHANAGAKVVLDSNALVQGTAAHLHGDSMAQVKAPDTKVGDTAVTINGSASVNISGGGATGSFAGGIAKLN